MRMGDLLHDRDALKERLTDIVEWKNLIIVNGYRPRPDRRSTR